MVEIISEYHGEHIDAVTAKVRGNELRKVARRYGYEVRGAGFCFSAESFSAFQQAIA